MRWRVIGLVSLGANLGLAAAWLSSRPPPIRVSEAPAPSLAAEATPRTNIVVRRQLLSWREIESADYPAYIANLRMIGCPEQTIRDIIIADVNALFSRRRATELVTGDQQWWRSEPDLAVVRASAEKARSLEDERRALLASLLGQTWESGDIISLSRPTRQPVVLDGPVLGSVSTETKLALQEANLRSQERMQAYLDAQAKEGKEPDPVEMSKLRKQTRDELARLLPSAQLEEYLLRYSQNANNLRTDFGQLHFTPTQEEFREVFRSTDALDQQIQSLAGAEPEMVRARKALEDQRENAIKIALGPKRYEEYRNLHDPLYRDAVAKAEAAGTPEAAKTIYAVSLAAALERDRINNDSDLTADQKNIELKQMELDQLKIAAGQDLPPEPPRITSPPRRTYVVNPGDSASVVSLIYGVPVSVLRQANPRLNLDRLKPGDSLNIPPRTLPQGAAP